MIDLDWLDEQLERALTDDVRADRHRRPTPPATPPPTPGHGTLRPRPVAPAVETPLDLPGHARRIEELVRLGRLAEADRHIAAHAVLAGRSGTPTDGADAAAWATMRALLDGRQADARAGADRVLALGRQAGDPDAWERYLTLRYRVVLEWGSDDEGDELLDRCREQAYWHDDLRWRGALTLLLARLGRSDEATRELDITVERGRTAGLPPAVWVDVTTDLVEAAAVLGAADRAAGLARSSRWPASGLVVSGCSDVCKGSIDRYRALAAAAAGSWPECDRHYLAAAETHRRLGARGLLARTLEEWAGTLARRDDHRAAALLAELAEVAPAP